MLSGQNPGQPQFFLAARALHGAVTGAEVNVFFAGAFGNYLNFNMVEVEDPLLDKYASSLKVRRE